MKKQILILSLFFLMFSSAGCQIEKQKTESDSPMSIMAIQNEAASTISTEADSSVQLTFLDFRLPAKKAMPGVVHVISTYKKKPVPQRKFDIPDIFKDFFDDDFRFFGDPNGKSGPRIGSGSGVIITTDGYIITNNHVISNSDEIEIILQDNRSYPAKVIGTDPATDLALLKIEEKDLSFIKLGNSDQLEVGEWVLAVGNPFNLSTTVTAGIVSAKARNINIIQDQASIESFIQTDAAVNPGNSGGALVNLKGELVGVNTAIASPTGTYAGYSFAIPANLAKKVIDDLLNYGEVQRAYLGVYIRNIDGDLAEELNLKNTEGVYVDSLMANGAAKEAGIKEKDVILKIDNEKVNSSPRLQEIIAGYHPGDEVDITLVRKGKERTVKVKLKSKSPKIAKKETKKILDVLGLNIQTITTEQKKEWKIEGGVEVTAIRHGKIRQHTNIRKGFIITKVNKQTITSVEELVEILESYSGGVMLEGFYPESPEDTYYFAFGL